MSVQDHVGDFVALLHDLLMYSWDEESLSCSYRDSCSQRAHSSCPDFGRAHVRGRHGGVRRSEGRPGSRTPQTPHAVLWPRRSSVPMTGNLMRDALILQLGLGELEPTRHYIQSQSIRTYTKSHFLVASFISQIRH